MKKLIYIIMCLAMVSCHSSKKAAKDKDPIQTDITTVEAGKTDANGSKTSSGNKNEVKEVYSPKEMNLTSKVKAKIIMGTQDVSTSGSLKMRWDEVIQLSLVDPILGITEVGRVEFSKDNILVIDRLNKQYCQETYEKLSSLTKQKLSFEDIQTLVWQQTEANINKDVKITIPAKKAINLNLRLTNPNNSDKWDAHTTVSSKYKKVDAETLFKALMQ